MGKYIPEDIISEIKNQAKILDIVSEYVRIKKAGRNYIGLCPFHEGKNHLLLVARTKIFSGRIN